MNEIELAEYARKKGLYVEQIKSWKDACMNANGGVAKEAAKLNRDLKDSQKEVKKLEKELQRKEKALAEAAALLVLSKKQMRFLGGPRGRKISASDRRKVILLIDEAVDNGARLSKACERLGITERTYYRWVKLNKTFDSYEDRVTGLTSIKYFLILIRLNLETMKLFSRYHKQRSLLTWDDSGQMKYSNYQFLRFTDN